MTAAVIWHDVECGSYSADLPIWCELAERAGGPVLELGAGTGRVALHLAERGHTVTAMDIEAELLEELAARAVRADVSVEMLHADARHLDVQGTFALVAAPMQFLQIVGGPQGRAEVLRGVAHALVPGGLFATAVAALDDAVAPDDAEPPLPDVGERDGWVYSSLPLDVRPEPGGAAVERLRQVVSPKGRLTEEHHTQLLDSLSPARLEREAAQAGLEAEARHTIAATPDHVGSEVVVCRR
ncbi:MAG TPA: class I SAM-dependent methyltransferase [Thermoleophilaceae bacterium]|nr:class I SAM-dependent methyltransferase [Thermoleophilaceae bacterium]